MARNALGRGLSALIRELEATPVVTTGVVSGQKLAAGGGQQVDIDLIDPSPWQPRSKFREETLEELAQSIRVSGIIQPVVLRPHGVRYQLIAGERRWRAAQRAGLQRVPAVVREVGEEEALELTLVENLQREDLNPMEQARAFERLMNQFHLTQEEVANRTGKDRATVANAVRLLKLEAGIQKLLEEGLISGGHGRALLAIEDSKLRMVLAEKAAKGRVTVRELERVASRGFRTRGSGRVVELDVNTRAALEELERSLGTRVVLRPRTGNRPGQLIIEYYDDSQLHLLYDRLARS